MKRDVIPTGLFTRTKYNNMNNYDTWLFEPYEKYYNEMEKLEAHLEQLSEMEEEDQQTYCQIHNLNFGDIQAY